MFANRYLDRRRERAAAVRGRRDEHRRVGALTVELRPRDVDPPGRVDMDRLVVRELAVPALGLPVAVPGRDRRQARGLPRDAGARHGAAVQQQLDLIRRREVERLADEVRRLTVWAERHDRIAARVVGAGAGDVGIVRVLRDPRQIALRQCARSTSGRRSYWCTCRNRRCSSSHSTPTGASTGSPGSPRAASRSARGRRG